MEGIGKNLKKYRLLNNLSLKKAGYLLHMSATAIAKYENNQIVPNSSKILEFAKTYNVRALDILKIYQEPVMKFTSFRKKKSLEGKTLDLLKNVIKEEVSKNIEVLDLCQINTSMLKLKQYKCNCIEDAEIAANEFRELIEISKKQPISDLINILENLGIVIIQIKNEKNIFSSFDGLSEIVNDIPFIVLLDGIVDGARERFTIAHELGHLVLNINELDINKERYCNRFASALLMPQEAVINEFGKTRKNINFYELRTFKLEYKASYTAIIYRLKDLSIISEYLYKKMSIFLSQNIGKKDRELILPEKSYQLKRIVHMLEAKKIISLSKASELLGITVDEYNQEDTSYRY